MKLRNLFAVLLIPILFTFTGCKSDSTTEPTAVDESKILSEYLEANGDYLNTSAPAIVSAQTVRDIQLTNPSKLLVIDVRTAADFATKGHIQGAVQVDLKNIVTYIKTVNTSSYDNIVIACYSGQTAGYATALLRLLGYSNVSALKWGMSSWNSQIANSWTTSIGNNYTSFTTTATSKAAAGTLPVLSTGKSTGREILEARITQLLSTTDPFGDAKIAYGTVTANASNYYIVNYWASNHYDLGHIPGAIQYTPKADLKIATSLKTLPANKTVVVYCYTGQTSAQVAAILRVMGYDAKSLLYGVNTMNYDWMTGKGMSQFAASEVKEFPFVTGSN
jgi:rhodanese-related sulfurtransferase